MNAPGEQMKRLESDVHRMAKIIDAPAEGLPTFGPSRDGGHPHIEVDDAGLHYVVEERGEELERHSTHEPGELFYWAFEAVTGRMAFQHELHRRKPGRDPRRIAFAYQLDLLERLNPRWALRRGLEIESMLREHPYNDEAVRRLDRTPGAS